MRLLEIIREILLFPIRTIAFFIWWFVTYYKVQKKERQHHQCEADVSAVKPKYVIVATRNKKLVAKVMKRHPETEEE